MVLQRYIGVVLLILSGCATLPQPHKVDNICHIFRQYPKWYYDTQEVARRWRVPIAVQMAIIHQESKFDGDAVPPRIKLLGLIPWMRPSTAYGYSQALDGTWSLYRRSRGGLFARRADFGDAVDFIGWYANQAYIRARIPRTDPYQLYLAYHEGVTGYMQGTYRHKPWLMSVARKVERRAQIYQSQLMSGCR